MKIIIYIYMESKIFHEIGLHKPDFDDHIYVTRRITACYSRDRNCFEGQENSGVKKWGVCDEGGFRIFEFDVLAILGRLRKSALCLPTARKSVRTYPMPDPRSTHIL